MTNQPPNPFLNLSKQPSEPYRSPLSSFLAHNTEQSKWAELLAAINRLHQNGLYYVRKRICLDGLTFSECAFENCEFEINTGNFSLSNCRIYGPETKFFYGGNALKIANLYEFMNASVQKNIVFPALFPKVDADGRITI